MTEQNIEQLFKTAFDHLEADVNPSVWTNIEQGLQTPVSGNPVSGNPSAIKSAGMFGKMGLKNLLLISAATVTVVGTVVYFATRKTESKIEQAVSHPQVTSEISPAVNAKIETPVTSNAPAAEVKKNTVKKEATPKKNDQGSTAVKPNSVNSPDIKEKETTSNSSAPAPAKISQHEPAVSPNHVSSAKPETADENKSNESSGSNSEPAKKDADPDPKFDQIEKYLVKDGFDKQRLHNSFSPNGDGSNDFFTIKTNGIKALEVIIFDRSGKEIYSWKSLDGAWDGKLSDGSEAPSGNYYYSLNAETMDGKICIAQSLLKLIR